MHQACHIQLLRACGTGFVVGQIGSTLVSQAILSCRRGCHQMPAVSTQQSHPAKIQAARLKRKSFPLLVLYVFVFQSC